MNNNNLFGENDNEEADVFVTDANDESQNSEIINENNDLPKMSVIDNGFTPQNSGDINKEELPAKPVIEIPQEYYDKLQREEEEKKKLEEEKVIQNEMLKNERKENSGFWLLVFVNFGVIAGTVYFLLQKSGYALIGLALYMLVGSAFLATSKKKNSSFSISAMIGGIVGALLFFILSIVKKNDDYIYFATMSGAIAILGWGLSAIVSYYLINRKEIKALQTIGLLLVLALIIGGPVYFYKKYPEQFYKYVMNKQNVIVATNEKEYVEKTLKNRYGVVFSCGDGKYLKTVSKIKTKRFICTDSSKNEIDVDSVAYNEYDLLYVVQDNYLEELYLNDFKKGLKQLLSDSVQGIKYVESDDYDDQTDKSLALYLYPKSNWCEFFGDCHDCDEYFKVVDDEKNLEKQFKYSSDLNLQKYVNKDKKDIVNDYGFKYIISAVLTGDSYDYQGIVEKILDTMNNYGLKNTSGFQISLKIRINDLSSLAYEVVGDARSDGKFSKYEVTYVRKSNLDENSENPEE